VFKNPAEVEPEYEEWPTPNCYVKKSGGKPVPPKMKVWRVQETPLRHGGVASPGSGFEEPDAEILALGHNYITGPNSVVVGRHGNFLQWGFSGSPSQMTAAGKQFFINCLLYIRKFDGKRPLVRREFPARAAAADFLAFLEKQQKQPLPADAIERVYAIVENETLDWRLDDDLKSLALTSNRQVETLKSLVAQLKDPAKNAVAQKLLARYTAEKLQTPEQWESWLKENDGRFFFTDVGGYKFMVVPKGYQSEPRP
jgi:hypothetical protein